MRWEGVETPTASLRNVRIFLMPSDIAGIYNSRGELTRLAAAHTVPKSQLHIFRGNSGKNTKQVSKTPSASLEDTIKCSETYKLITAYFPSALSLSLCVLINHNFYKLYMCLYYIIFVALCRSGLVRSLGKRDFLIGNRHVAVCQS